VEHQKCDALYENLGRSSGNAGITGNFFSELMVSLPSNPIKSRGRFFVLLNASSEHPVEHLILLTSPFISPQCLLGIGRTTLANTAFQESRSSMPPQCLLGGFSETLAGIAFYFSSFSLLPQ